MLRLWDPQAQAWLPTPAELLARTDEAREQAEQRAAHEADLRQQAEAEVERLRQELAVGAAGIADNDAMPDGWATAPPGDRSSWPSTSTAPVVW